MSLECTARVVQVVIDDDEGATFMFVKWSNIGGYLSISCDEEDSRLYCEYCDQSNGFYSESLDMVVSGNRVVLTLNGKESFSSAELVQRIAVTFDGVSDFNEIVRCIDVLKSHRIEAKPVGDASFDQ